jgi:hypothetical protein
LYALILTIAASQPITLHTDPTAEGAYYRAALANDIYVRCETTSAARFYQSQFDIKHKTSLDNFIEIGQRRTEFPLMCREGNVFVVLFIKRELDLHHRDHIVYDFRPEYSDAHIAQFGMVDLGDGGQHAARLPLPWEEGFED